MRQPDSAHAVTMADVARRAGVSRATASFVINNHPNARISTATRERVNAAASQLGYHPHAGTRALAMRRSGLIGLVTEVVTTPYAADLIRGIEDQARIEGLGVLITGIDPDQYHVPGHAVETMLQHRVNALIYAAVWHREIGIPAAAAHIPSVLVHCFDATGLHSSVIPNEHDGGYRATRHLIDAGHRRVAYINLHPDIPAAVGRRAGYVQALTQAGIDVDEGIIVSGDGMADDGYECAKHVLSIRRPPTAIFCATDRIAMGAYDAIKELGLRIPQDIAVVGFDNQPLIAQALRPGLTTVELPFHSMGLRAVELLVAGQPPTREVIDCPLIERHSVRA
jgi:LacI family transcriptional regulator